MTMTKGERDDLQRLVRQRRDSVEYRSGVVDHGIFRQFRFETAAEGVLEKDGGQKTTEAEAAASPPRGYAH